MQSNEYYRDELNFCEADIAGAPADAYGQQQQYEQYGYEQAAAAPVQGPGQWQQLRPHPVAQPQFQPTHTSYGFTVPTMSAPPPPAAHGLPLPQQVTQAPPVPDQFDDSLKAVRDMPTPFQQLYSYR
jgi:hypothetical protein